MQARGAERHAAKQLIVVSTSEANRNSLVSPYRIVASALSAVSWR